MYLDKCLRTGNYTYANAKETGGWTNDEKQQLKSFTKSILDNVNDTHDSYDYFVDNAPSALSKMGNVEIVLKMFDTFKKTFTFVSKYSSYYSKGLTIKNQKTNHKTLYIIKEIKKFLKTLKTYNAFYNDDTKKKIDECIDNAIQMKTIQPQPMAQPMVIGVIDIQYEFFYNYEIDVNDLVNDLNKIRQKTKNYIEKIKTRSLQQKKIKKKELKQKIDQLKKKVVKQKKPPPRKSPKPTIEQNKAKRPPPPSTLSTNRQKELANIIMKQRKENKDVQPDLTNMYNKRNKVVPPSKAPPNTARRLLNKNDVEFTNIMDPLQENEEKNKRKVVRGGNKYGPDGGGLYDSVSLRF